MLLRLQNKFLCNALNNVAIALRVPGRAADKQPIDLLLAQQFHRVLQRYAAAIEQRDTGSRLVTKPLASA